MHQLLTSGKREGAAAGPESGVIEHQYTLGGFLSITTQSVQFCLLFKEIPFTLYRKTF